ncbi:hypothetical protein V500_00608 [Pseudogymnoascus sp. VKM F-4518 (FW-2643)]|nr:hypothetical protein V500_00608 [Pseudogymnoascus sp. VKM F-4518 (FW-2643)]
MLLSLLFTAVFFALQSVAVPASKPASFIRGYDKRDALQDVVTWDKHSLFVHGERVMIFSGEFHPWRLPVPSLWIDIFQKIKALGYNTVSFYVNWALLEGKPGEFTAEGVFAYEPFFEAAKDAGIWLIARPGPYINAEVSGGGFPGWLQRLPGALRTSASDYLNSTDLYVSSIARIIAKAQITNGGPVILYQPENEYSGGKGIPFPNGEYLEYVETQVRKAGVVVPLINNDAWSNGIAAPGTGKGQIDIYGYDNYPVGWTCSEPTAWQVDGLRTDLYSTHEMQSPYTPHAIPEFQGGASVSWGSVTLDHCAELVSHEAERVFYKNNYASGVTIMNLYMTYGGTNWGNLGYSGGYTSYDYGAVIAEDRTITREKFSEAKLQAQFLKVSPAYLTAVPASLSTSLYSNTADISVTPVIEAASNTSFYVVRHSVFNSTITTSYNLKITTRNGALTLPQLGGRLTLSGRDSKIHVTDYDVGGTNLLYSTAEVFTWKNFTSGTVLILYGGPGELHEAAITTTATSSIVEGTNVQTKYVNGALVMQWHTTSSRRIVQVGNLLVYILDRNSAYNYWVPDLGDGRSVIVKAGYLIRTAYTAGDTLHLTGDFNATTSIEVIGASNKRLKVNGKTVDITISSTGALSGIVQYNAPSFNLPNYAQLHWKSIDALPELQTNYDDHAWVSADHKTSTNPYRNLTTPTSLYSSDYGFHAGSLLYRGHFVATGSETTLSVHTQGGVAYGVSAWLNGTTLGSYAGTGYNGDYNSTYSLGNLVEGKSYVITILIDNNGYDENWWCGADDMKNPHGILDYSFSGRPASAITWKLAGNIGGEDYVDKTRGPLNEGGLFPERQGWHQPGPPTGGWGTSTPMTGISQEGVMFYSTKFDLDIPSGWDIPLYFTFPEPSTDQNYRVQLYVNGYQFGKYISNIGPQFQFPVPQGILNYSGANTVALTLWAQQPGGAKIETFSLTAGTPVMTALKDLALVPRPGYTKRPGAY